MTELLGGTVISIIRTTRSSSFCRHVAIVATGTLVAQAIPVILTPILTRLYSPSDMGTLGLYVSFISFFSSALTLGYAQAIVTGRTDDEALDLTIISGLLICPISLLGGILLLLFSKLDLLGYGELPVWTAIVMVASLLLTGCFFTLRYWLIRSGSYKIISTATVSQSFGRMGTQVILGLLNFQWVGLMLGEVMGRGAGMGRFWAATSDDIKNSLTNFNAEKMWSTARYYKKFPLLTTPSALLNSASLVLPVPLITMYFGIGSAGQFSVATRIMILPLSLIGASVGDVFHSRIAQISRENPERAMRFFLNVVIGLAVLGVAPAIVIASWGDQIFPFILGSSWQQAGAIAAAITPWVFMQLAVSPVSRIVQVYQGQEFKLVYDCLALLSIAGILILGHNVGWSLEDTCRILGWSQAVAYAVYLGLLIRVLNKYKFINGIAEDNGGAFAN